MTTLCRMFRGARAGLGVLGLLCAFHVVHTAPALADEPPVLAISPQSAGRDAVVSMSFSAPQHCQGDSEAGYLWQTFITPSTNDPVRLTYAVGLPTGRGFTTGLRDSTNSWIRNRNPGLTDGQVIPPGSVTFEGAAYDGMPDGEYLLGIACTKQSSDGVTRTTRVWKRRVRISSSSNGGFLTLLDEPAPTTLGPSSTTVAPEESGRSTGTTSTVPVSNGIAVASAGPADTASLSTEVASTTTIGAGPQRIAASLPKAPEQKSSWGLVAVCAAAGAAGVVAMSIVIRQRRRRGVTPG